MLIAPDDLRQGSTLLGDSAAVLKGLARSVGRHSLPEMPPELASLVKTETSEIGRALGGAWAPLVTQAKELRVRAVWAEIADARAEGRTLTSAELREVFALMKDGSLLRSASPKERRFAGELLGATYRSTFEDPKKLIELAGLMRANAHDKDFAGGFIERFGADNLAKIPRVIQAIEYPHQIEGNLSDRLRKDIARELLRDNPNFRYDGDVVEELLAPFTEALAVSTSTGTLTRAQQQSLAANRDKWAVATLLSHEGKYGKEFLLDAFKTGVVDEIVDEHRTGRRFSDPSDTSLNLGGSDNKGGLPRDGKVLILNALGRNGDAAAAALTTPLDPIRLTRLDGSETLDVRDPLKLLLEFGHYQDDGRALGGASASAVAGLHDDNRHDAANRMTLRLVDEVIAGERDDLKGLRPGVARTVADPDIMRDLHTAAASDEADLKYDPDGDGVLGSSDEDGISISNTQLRELLGELTADGDARGKLLAGVAAHQSQEILANTGPDAPRNHQWATGLGNFNAILLEAGNDNRLEDLAARQARHEQIFGAIDTVTSLVPLGDAGGAAASTVIDGIADGRAPSEQDTSNENFKQGQELRGRLQASIVAGYYEQGKLGDARDIESYVRGLERGDAQLSGHEATSFLRDGHIVPYSEMSPAQRATFEAWTQSDGVQDRVHAPLQSAENGIDERSR